MLNHKHNSTMQCRILCLQHCPRWLCTVSVILCLAMLVQYQLMTDGQTGVQTNDHSRYHASIASHGKNCTAHCLRLPTHVLRHAHFLNMTLCICTGVVQQWVKHLWSLLNFFTENYVIRLLLGTLFLIRRKVHMQRTWWWLALSVINGSLRPLHLSHETAGNWLPHMMLNSDLWQ